MALTTIPSSGAKLRASVLEDLVTEVRPTPATKAGDTSVNTDATHNADPDLTITLVPGVWEVRALLIVTSAADAAGDFSFRWAYPADATLSEGGTGATTALASGTDAGNINVAGTSLDAATPAGPYSFGASTSATAILAWATITIVTTGAVTIEWCQAASNANNTTLKGGSTLVGRRLS